LLGWGQGPVCCDSVRPILPAAFCKNKKIKNKIYFLKKY